ncbi:MAG TPA: hypothetical protein V6C65_27165 [Allocoleopsis sp.]
MPAKRQFLKSTAQFPWFTATVSLIMLQFLGGWLVPHEEFQNLDSLPALPWYLGSMPWC